MSSNTPENLVGMPGPNGTVALSTYDPANPAAPCHPGNTPIDNGPHPDPRGRPLRQVCGRKAILARLDAMLADENNVRKIADGLQAELDLNPAKFFHDRVVPLIPTEMLREDRETEDTAEAKAAKIREAMAAAERLTLGEVHVEGTLTIASTGTNGGQPANTPTQ